MTAAAKASSKSANPTLYRSTLQEAASGGAALMGRLVQAARQVLQNQEAATRNPQERDALGTAANQLRRSEQSLCTAYTEALLKGFAGQEGAKKSSVLSMAEVQFDQLELMDDGQVQTSVMLARLQQSVAVAAESSLNDLNTLMSGLLGVSAVRADLNPLRPDVYITALKEVVAQTQLPVSLQLHWLGAMAPALGPELHALYVALCAKLRKQGVTAVLYAAPAGFSQIGGAVAAPTAAAPARSPQAGRPATGVASPAKAAPATRGQEEAALLTLDKLHQLLAGELNPFPKISHVEDFAARFAREFDEPASPAAQGVPGGFAATVPAALEALTEMKQVDQVVQSLEQRRDSNLLAGDTPDAHSVEGQRLALRRNARDTAQALSLEVVTLMVENMARDARLLEPVRQVLRNLEPALLRLVLVDPRFFIDKQHPARRLLNELTQRSLAFDSTEATGFDGFLHQAQGTLAPLFQASIESAEIFEAKLAALRAQWTRETQVNERQREVAVDVLQHAEARNLLAQEIARRIEGHPDSAQVPAVVLDFLCGPWSQVVAQARIKQGSGSAEAEKYEALIPAMLWSAHPELARTSPAKLTRLVPRLLTNLREGLETIQYPATRTSVFLEALMAIHQQVFRGEAPMQPAAFDDVPTQPATVPDRVRSLDDDPWIAPEEALASNFVALEAPSAPAEEGTPDLLDLPGLSNMAGGDFPLGSWVELESGGQWQRTQLTWASPHGTLFLFTGAFGNTQSMTRRSRDKLLESGRLRLLSGQSVDEGALNAVAQTAMRNSLDTTL